MTVRPRGLAAAVTLLSAATTGYEILLVRLLAVEQFHHFASMVIGVALLGSGMSGTLAALLPPANSLAAAARVRWAAAITAAALVASPWAIHAVRVEPSQLAWNGAQWPRLAALVVALALPFAAGALATLTAFTLEPERAGRLYGASFAGGALGVALAIATLFALPPGQALAVPPLLGALGALRLRRTGVFGLIALGSLASAALFITPLWSLQLTPYKSLPQIRALPGAQVVAEETSPLGWVVAVHAPSFRFAPGLSLEYRGGFPAQTALLVDGDIAGVATDLRSVDAAELAEALPTALPWALGPWRRVLLIGVGSGLELKAALGHGAERVVTLELNPELLRFSRRLGPPDTVEAQRIEDRTGDARGELARPGQPFDLITLTPTVGYGASIAGVRALDEDFLHTVDAYELYLRRLAPGGVLSVTNWLSVPPRESVRTILTAAEALRRVTGSASHGLLVARSWGTVTVLARPAGYTAEDFLRLQDFARQRSLDLDWPPEVSGDTEPFHTLDDPALREAAAAGVSSPSEAARFAGASPFDVAPVDDARPYPHHFVRPRSMLAFLRSARGNWLPFAEWGPIAITATLVQAVLVSTLLLLVPAAIWARRPARTASFPAFIGFFAALGFAYVTAELAVIQQLGLLLGHPVYAVAAALTVLLACSGAGSAWSDRIAPSLGPRACAVLAALLLLGAALLLGAVHALQATALPFRALAAFVCLATPAFIMGLPFPLGLRALAKSRGEVAWAWAANGFASVIGAPFGALIGLEAGSRVLFLAAGAAYALAGVLQWSVVHGQLPWAVKESGARLPP
jgi:hypothetical protein